MPPEPPIGVADTADSTCMLTRLTAIILVVTALGVVLADRIDALPIGGATPQIAPPPLILEAGSYCAPLDCADVSVAAPPGFDYADAADFVPDRRPVLRINLFGGPCLTPPSGGPPWWHELGDADGNGIIDAVDTLLGKLNDGYADGWRRMIIRLPAGAYTGVMSSSQWWPMPTVKRQSLTNMLPLWLAAHPDATIGMYSGYPILDPCRLCMQTCGGCIDCETGMSDCNICPECAGLPSAHWPETTNADDMCIVFQNIEPWITLGLYEIWFDASGGAHVPRWETLLRLAGNPDYVGRVRMAGEAIVIEQHSGATSVPLMPVVERMPFVSLRRYYENVGRNAPVEAWTFDPAATEVHAMFGDDQFCIDQDPNDGDPCTGCDDWCDGVPDPPVIDVINDYIQRGFVAAPSEAEAEHVRRILGINTQSLPCIEDLDVDGDVDGADADRLAANIGMTSGATLYHGDVDFDDDVDIIDYFLLVSRPGFPGPCN
jgi:hypothetical protein